MKKKVESNEIVLYNYGDFIGRIILPAKIDIFIGDEIDIDFDDQKIKFVKGEWDRPTGLYCFTVHFLRDFNEEEVGVVQFAMEDP
jgi:hypothetical protein